MAKAQIASQPEGMDQWQTRDDANKIMDYANLRSDKERHKRAVKHLRSATKLVSRKSSRGGSR